MSRVGRLPIKIPNNIVAEYDSGVLSFKAQPHSFVYNLSRGLEAEIANGSIRLKSKGAVGSGDSRKMGMDRSNINNLLTGFSTPFKIVLEVNGVGYKALIEKNILILVIGYSHEVFYAIPSNVSILVEKSNTIIISGAVKELIGQVASEIVGFRPPEPYKGKGLKLLGQKILRKQGKKK